MTPVKVECHGGSWMDEDLLKSTLEFLTRDALTYVVVDESQDFKSSAPTHDGLYRPAGGRTRTCSQRCHLEDA
jgi:hypothetical protein